MWRSALGFAAVAVIAAPAVHLLQLGRLSDLERMRGGDGFDLPDIPNITGKVAIVTGPSLGGTGFESALALARRGAHVVLAGRNEDKGRAALEAIRAEVGNAKVEFMSLDLASLASVQAFAKAFRRRRLPLHILLLNAGVFHPRFTLTDDGIEGMFATNHLGHFLLTKLLLHTLIQSAPSRVVVVSGSAAHWPELLGLNLSDVGADSEARHGALWALGRSKLANHLFAVELARLLEALGGSEVYANAVSPGLSKTGFVARLAEYGLGMRLVLGLTEVTRMEPRRGALTQLYLAASPAVEKLGIKGKWFYPQCRDVQPSKLVTLERARELWELSDRLVKGFG